MNKPETIEVNEYKMIASNGRPIRTATVISIDGHQIHFTEKLTSKQVARYIESRKAQQLQALRHAEMEALGG